LNKKKNLRFNLKLISKTMKKIFLVLAVVIFAAVNLNAQSPAFEKGDKVLSFTAGLPYVSTYSAVIPPVMAGLEVGIVDGILERGAVGIGGYLGFQTFSHFSNVLLGVRGAFHYTFVDNLDTYAGFSTGWRLGFAEDGYTAWTGFTHSEFIGARYYFTNSFAVQAEMGYGISWLTAGVAFKF
jgi:hypothetical protein